MTTIEDRVAALEHHALLTSTEALSTFTEKLAKTEHLAEELKRALADFRTETGEEFVAVRAEVAAGFAGVTEQFTGVNAQLAAINQLLVRLAGEAGEAGQR
jgi:hypothetical protein